MTCRLTGDDLLALLALPPIAVYPRLLAGERLLRLTHSQASRTFTEGYITHDNEHNKRLAEFCSIVCGHKAIGLADSFASYSCYIGRNGIIVGLAVDVVLVLEML